MFIDHGRRPLTRVEAGRQAMWECAKAGAGRPRSKGSKQRQWKKKERRKAAAEEGDKSSSWSFLECRSATLRALTRVPDNGGKHTLANCVPLIPPQHTLCLQLEWKRETEMLLTFSSFYMSSWHIKRERLVLLKYHQTRERGKSCLKAGDYQLVTEVTHSLSGCWLVRKVGERI